jgi:hypothetical protein
MVDAQICEMVTTLTPSKCLVNSTTYRIRTILTQSQKPMLKLCTFTKQKIKSTKVRLPGFQFVCYKLGCVWGLCVYKSMTGFKFVYKPRLCLGFGCMCLHVGTQHIHTPSFDTYLNTKIMFWIFLCWQQ